MRAKCRALESLVARVSLVALLTLVYCSASELRHQAPPSAVTVARADETKGRAERRADQVASAPADLSELLVAGERLDAPHNAAHPHTSGTAQFDDIAEGLEGPLETSAQLEASSSSEDPRRSNVSLLESIKRQANQTAKNAASGARGGGGAGIEPVERLDRDFISLFDELWLIKNSSVAALVQLQFFDNATLGRRAGPDESSPAQVRRKFTGSQSPNQTRVGTNSQSWWRPTSGGAISNGNFITQRAKQQETPARRKLAEAAGRVGGWLASAQQRFWRAKERFAGAGWGKLFIAAGGAASPSRGAMPVEAKLLRQRPGAPDVAGPEPPSPLVADLEGDGPAAARRKRDVPGGEAPATAETCNRLTIDEEATCREKETLINANLNISFPGTARAIEENCQHVTHLLANCWPAQLAQLRASSLSPSLLLLLHNGESGDSQLPPPPPLLANSCGLGEPRSPQYIRDRVSWMWLNLCADKRFRQSYIDNLRCLSTWSQEKAQMVCNHDYRRMQTYLVGQAVGHGFEWTSGSKQYAAGAGGAQNNNLSGGPTGSPLQPARGDGSSESPVEERLAGGVGVASVGGVAGPGSTEMGSSSQLAHANSSTNNNNNNNNKLQEQATAAGVMSESELVVREVNSKLLCCMFDQFLRCVHKQAVRDCGRPGAQFVVNFLSRIGTDDMKQLCNSESRASLAAAGPPKPRPHPSTATTTTGMAQPQKSRTSNSPPPSPPDRSPFIESNYCTEPRIQSALANNGPDGSRSSGAQAAAGVSAGAPGAPSSTLGSGLGLVKSGGGSSGRIRGRPGGGHLSHDPTFFGTYIMSASSAASPHVNMGELLFATCVLFASARAIFMSPLAGLFGRGQGHGRTSVGPRRSCS